MLNHQFDRRPWVALGLVTLSFLPGCQSPAAVTAPEEAAPPAPAPQAAAAQPTRHVMGFGFGGPTFNPLVLPNPLSGPAVYDPVQKTVLQFPAGGPLGPDVPPPVDGAAPPVAGPGLPGGLPGVPPGPGLIGTNPPATGLFYAPGAFRNLPFPVNSAVFSPNGHWALYTAGGTCFLYDCVAAVQYSVPFIHPTFFDLRVFDVSPDLRFLLYASDGVLRQLDLRTGWTINFSLVPGFFDDAHFGPDGTVGFIRNGQLQAYNPTSGLLDTLPIANRGLYGF